MERVFEFLTSHPYLVGVFVVLLGLFIRNETQRGGASVSAQQLVELVNREDAVIVDVRDKKEFDAGHIVDSINVPHGSLESHVDELKKFVDRPLVVACKVGQHSGAAGTMLRKNGFSNVSRLTGGIAEWRNQNLPVVKS